MAGETAHVQEKKECIQLAFEDLEPLWRGQPLCLWLPLCTVTPWPNQYFQYSNLLPNSNVLLVLHLLYSVYRAHSLQASCCKT